MEERRSGGVKEGQPGGGEGDTKSRDLHLTGHFRYPD